MTYKSHALPADAQERKQFHAALSQWMCEASDEEFLKLEQARERFAPNQICSIFNLVSGCLARKELEELVPPKLRQLLRERNWPQACASAKAL